MKVLVILLLITLIDQGLSLPAIDVKEKDIEIDAKWNINAPNQSVEVDWEFNLNNEVIAKLVTVNTETPVTVNTETPVTVNIETPVTVNTETPVTVNTETPVSVTPEESSCVAKSGQIIAGECFSYHLDKGKIQKSECVSTCEGKGGKLAEPNSTHEFLQQVGSVFPEIISHWHWHWMGGSDAEEEGTWIYTDGRAVAQQSQDWYPGNPNGGSVQNCLLFYYYESSARLGDFYCSSSETQYCFCQL